MDKDSNKDGHIEISSTKIQIEEFKDSLIWQDIVNELNVWVEGLNVELDNIVDDAKEENPSTASVFLHMGDINGCKKTVQYVKFLPDMFLEMLKVKSEDKEQDNNND